MGSYSIFGGGVAISGYIFYNPNPDGNRVGDCTVRALCRATGHDWDYVHSMLCAISNELCDMPSANHVWGAYLRQCGFRRYLVDDRGKDVYTVRDFCGDHPEGTYVLAMGSHVVCAVDGSYYDSWDSGGEIPQYYWTK